MDDQPPKSELFNAYYYAHDCGEPYCRNEAWLNLFDSFAERIYQDIQPTTVLDAGCAIGLLVEVLRKRGMQAWGVDISEFAIQNAHPDIRLYCKVGSITEPFEIPHYDLIVCIEVLEHLPKEDADKAIANLCQHSDDILFSSTPFDYNEATHFNVQPTEYWVEHFARHGFFRDVDFDASFITPWAIRFRLQKITPASLARDYERQLMPLLHGNIALRKQVINNRDQLESFEKRLAHAEEVNQALADQLNERDQVNQSLADQLHERDQVNQSLADQRHELEQTNQTLADQLQVLEQANQSLADHSHELEQVNQSLTDQIQALEQANQILTGQLREQNKLNDEAHQQISTLIQMVSEKDRTLQEILTSRSWRLMTKVQSIRLRLIPLGSRRERLMVSTLAGLRLLLRAGPIAFVRRLNEKISRQIKILSLRQQHAQSLQAHAFPVETYQGSETAPVPAHQANVDIIVCVHNALEDLQRCLESIVRYTLPPYRLILVDDGSDQPTKEYLAEFSRMQGAVLLRNDQARGYTCAANQGLSQTSAPYTLLLNSDTIVTPRWLDRMVACGESDPKIGMVGPLSNTASWQSVPDIFDASGDWAENKLMPGITIPEMAEWIAAYSGRLYPTLPFLNGFCLLIKRQLIDAIGIFDEENFGQGYGEENDYCLRATKAGWQLAVADDTYIYHAQSRSYSDERRKALVERSDKALVSKHGQAVISDGAYICRFDRVMQGNRARSQVMALRQQTIAEGKRRWEGKRVLFVLPISEAGGGGHVIVQEAEAMRQMGVDVRILNLKGHQYFFDHAYPGLQIPTLYVDEPRQAAGLLSAYDAVIGTVYHSLNWMELPASAMKVPVRGYYIQDFEPNFFPKGSSDYQAAWDSYTRFPDLVRITKTEWNRQIIREQVGVDCHVVGASLDLELLRPRKRRDPDWPDRPLRITAMIRPSTPRRQPEFTLLVLSKLIKQHHGNIEVILFGCQPDDPDFHKLIGKHPGLSMMPWRHAGMLTRTQLASLLNEIDVFADFSSFQALGLTAMEAMACGAAVLLPKEGGAATFARHKENAIVTNTSSLDTAVDALNQLLHDQALRSRLQQQSISDMCQFYPEKAAFKTLEAIFS